LFIALCVLRNPGLAAGAFEQAEIAHLARLVGAIGFENKVKRSFNDMQCSG